ncbi:Wzz/FepE/Etk N-terminal domain-containing protein [Alkalihalobacillus sp. LMS39]|uniref:YveK family protein n=1 Tax=Alkalihalobacillus sp. LMS39 TaxID=2924032 RepID=UPI001FB4A164|nr:Wzz/FepE/Etk N-terminal domain-containing protein [Alkalihalobacillus sp. LMS39]UOE93879.1 Wzz/FepE/Etk N-terminal domain-containing protein [Alkalihalobacillus sp. LMS39]
MEETISLQEIFATIRRRIKLIILIPILAVLVSGIISYFVLTPVYESSTQLLVNQTQQEQNINSNDIRANLEIINTYNVIIKSPVILEKVIAEANLSETVGQVNNRITVGSEGNSQVVKITVQHEQPELAVLIANTVADVFQREIVTIMNVDNVNILSPAQLSANPSPVAPKPTLNMAIAFVVGLMIAVGIAFLLEYLDTSVKDEQDIEKLLELPILGVVPNMDNDKKKRRGA